MEFRETGHPAKLAGVAEEAKLVVNLTSGTVVCDQVTVADRARSRMRGLIGRDSLPDGDGLLLQPAPSIHTAFMRFPIDVVFMDGTLRVLKVVERLPPWRTASARRAKAVLELACGEAGRRAVAIGDQLGILEVCDRVGSVESGAFEGGRVRPFPRHRIARQADGDAPGPAGPAAKHDQSNATRVLLIAQDRRFRTVAAALLTRRGCVVTLADGASSVDLRDRTSPHVVVLDVGTSLADTTRATDEVDGLGHGVGLVLVGDEPGATRYRIPVVAKWGAFDRLYDAVEHAARAAHTEGTFSA